MPLRIGMEMPSLEGATEWINGEASTERLKGAPTLVQFWAVSCYICKNNMPRIESWKEKYEDMNFVSIHMPRQESDTDVAAVTAAVAEFGIDEPCAVDNDHIIGERFQTSGYWPYYFLFDAEGKMKSRAAGDAGLGMIETAIKRLVEEAVGEPVTA
jgi:thiol-disulfide isomerase/thioredoxin